MTIQSSTSSKTMMVCASHSPLLDCYKRPPADHDAVEATFSALHDDVEAFDPELVFMFGPDHYTSLFQQLAPPFTIATAAEAVDDIGGRPGKLNVPAKDAIACIEYLARNGLDAAVSHSLRVDHGISQTLFRLTGRVDRYPTVPVIINTMTRPLPPFHRSRTLGTLIGRFARESGKRVLFLASGGLSHNPKVIYPDIGEGEADVTSWQIHGRASAQMSPDAWYGRLEDIHHVAAQMLVDGKITAEDCCFNEDFDKKVIDILTSGRFSDMDDWNNDEAIRIAGIGSVEVHGWLAAAAAHREMGGDLPSCRLYTQALEYGIAFGLMQGTPAAA